MGSVVNKVVEVGSLGLVKDVTGSEAAQKASSKAAAQAAAAKGSELEYLQAIEEIPQMFRESALKKLGGLYGLEGGEGDQQALIEQAMASPFYQQSIESGEDAVLRSAAATGGLRSGNVQEALADVSNQALLQSYSQQLAGLEGLASLPSNAANIGAAMSDIGQIQAQGTMAKGQMARDDFMNFANLGMSAAGAYMMSDRRLKKNITLIGYNSGLPVYHYEWNEKGNELGLHGEQVGFVAQEVESKYPDHVKEIDGYKRIDLSFMEEAA